VALAGLRRGEIKRQNRRWTGKGLKRDASDEKANGWKRLVSKGEKAKGDLA